LKRAVFKDPRQQSSGEGGRGSVNYKGGGTLALAYNTPKTLSTLFSSTATVDLRKKHIKSQKSKLNIVDILHFTALKALRLVFFGTVRIRVNKHGEKVTAPRARSPELQTSLFSRRAVNARSKGSTWLCLELNATVGLSCGWVVASSSYGIRNASR
jgi:hypothetical protein